jgi:putative PIN family toxin of toxin-antitoxin system
MVLSDYILEEVDEVLSRIPGVPITTRHTAVKVLMESCRMVIPAEGTWEVRDSEDLPIVGTAVAGQVDYLVTGDKDLLSVQKVDTVLIVTPRSFASIVAVE